MTVHRLDIKRKKRAILRDLFPICFIALFGSFGFVYIFNSDCIPENNSHLHSSSNLNLASHSLSLSTLSTYKDPFIIEGNQVSDNVLQFQLRDYDPEASYLMEVSNGESLEINSPNFEYSFEESGKFQLRLNIEYADKRPVVLSKYVMIGDNDQLSYHKNLDNI